MPFSFGDVVLVKFPFTNQSAIKQRPAVIVSNSGYSLARPDVVAMAVTSQFRPSPGFGDVWLRDWQAAGLLKPSVVKPVFATLEQIIIIRALGVLSSGDQDQVKQAIVAVLG